MEIKQHKLIGLQIVVFDNFERIENVSEIRLKMRFCRFFMPRYFLMHVYKSKCIWFRYLFYLIIVCL